MFYFTDENTLLNIEYDLQILSEHCYTCVKTTNFFRRGMKRRLTKLNVYKPPAFSLKSVLCSSKTWKLFSLYNMC